MEQLSIEERLRKVEERNERVETDKAWEVSFARKVCIAVLTYVIAFSVLWIIDAGHAAQNAWIPVIGYILSTQSLPFFKSFWLRRRR